MSVRDEKFLPFGEERLSLPGALREAVWLDREPNSAAGGAPSFAAAAGEAAGRVTRMLGAGKRLALVVPDRTRPLDLPRLLPRVLDALAARGVEPERIDLVPASGLHAPMTVPELRAFVGEGAAGRGCRLLPHDGRGRCTQLGVTADGIKVAAHPAVAGAGAVLVLGRLVFHYLAGYGGGRKMLVPGVAAEETILAVHRRCLADTPGSGRHPRARAGLLEGNPVHLAACAAARLFPPTVGIHVELDGQGAVCRAVAGDLFADHAAAAAAYAASHSVEAAGPFELVVVSAGGHPTDRNLVQAHKALDAVAPLLTPDAQVVLLARCADGAGNDELVEGLRLGGAVDIEAALRRDFRVGLHTALALRTKTARWRVRLVSALDDRLARLAGLVPELGLEGAVHSALAELGGKARLAVAPRGAALLYRLGERRDAAGQDGASEDCQP